MQYNSSASIYKKLFACQKCSSLLLMPRIAQQCSKILINMFLRICQNIIKQQNSSRAFCLAFLLASAFNILRNFYKRFFYLLCYRNSQQTSLNILISSKALMLLYILFALFLLLPLLLSLLLLSALLLLLSALAIKSTSYQSALISLLASICNAQHTSQAKQFEYYSQLLEFYSLANSLIFGLAYFALCSQ